jgi:hypothetical protein
MVIVKNPGQIPIYVGYSVGGRPSRKPLPCDKAVRECGIREFESIEGARFTVRASPKCVGSEVIVINGADFQMHFTQKATTQGHETTPCESTFTVGYECYVSFVEARRA